MVDALYDQYHYLWWLQQLRSHLEDAVASRVEQDNKRFRGGEEATRPRRKNIGDSTNMPLKSQGVRKQKERPRQGSNLRPYDATSVTVVRSNQLSHGDTTVERNSIFNILI